MQNCRINIDGVRLYKLETGATSGSYFNWFPRPRILHVGSIFFLRFSLTSPLISNGNLEYARQIQLHATYADVMGESAH